MIADGQMWYLIGADWLKEWHSFKAGGNKGINHVVFGKSVSSVNLANMDHFFVMQTNRQVRSETHNSSRTMVSQEPE